jgi:MauM/NapG family ferredoxin protein
VSADRNRRQLLVLGAAGLAGTSIALSFDGAGRPEGALRPPGALPEPAFLAACIRCSRCGPVCPTGAVRFADAFGPEGATPYIVPRERACILCMRCTEACPTGALALTPPDHATVAARVKMGVARLEPTKCLAHRDTGICRACWYACPFADAAIALDGALRPVVDPGACVGCGLCEHACPSHAQAIIVVPT